MKNMTKVELHFRVVGTLDDAKLESLADNYAKYGFNRIRLSPDLSSLTVDYDATRLTPEEVSAILRRSGLPVERQEALTA